MVVTKMEGDQLFISPICRFCGGDIQKRSPDYEDSQIYDELFEKFFQLLKDLELVDGRWRPHLNPYDVSGKGPSLSYLSDIEGDPLLYSGAIHFLYGKPGTLKSWIGLSTLGESDVRVWDLCESPDGVKRDLGQKMVADIKALARRNNAKMWDYDARTGVLELGHLKVIHGYHTGMNACAAHARIYGNCVFGHIHSIESYQVPGIHQKEARSIGCLCDLNPRYANRKTGKLRWANGWAYGWLFEDGHYHISQVRKVGGKFYAQTDLKEY
jgi:hypothetical protein